MAPRWPSVAWVHVRSLVEGLFRPCAMKQQIIMHDTRPFPLPTTTTVDKCAVVSPFPFVVAVIYSKALFVVTRMPVSQVVPIIVEFRVRVAWCSQRQLSVRRPLRRRAVLLQLAVALPVCAADRVGTRALCGRCCPGAALARRLPATRRVVGARGAAHGRPQEAAAGTMLFHVVRLVATVYDGDVGSSGSGE